MLMLLYKKEVDKSINKQDYNILMTLHLSDVFSIIFSLCNDFLHNAAKCITTRTEAFFFFFPQNVSLLQNKMTKLSYFRHSKQCTIIT